MLWQGRPAAWSVTRHALHMHLIAAYFALLAGWRFVWLWQAGAPFPEIIMSSATILAVGVACLLLIALMGRLISRTSLYTITTKRFVMRYGIALPVTVQVPFTVITSADVRTYSDGSADIAFAVSGENPLNHYHLWPHVRAWRLAKAQPMMRCLGDAETAVRVLRLALQASAGQSKSDVAPALVTATPTAKSQQREAPATTGAPAVDGIFAPNHATPAAA